MYTKKIQELVSTIETLTMRGPEETEITGIAYDSRFATSGCLFAALPGVHTDGAAFIDAAISAGARAILAEKSPDTWKDNVFYIIVRDVHCALSALSSAFYGHPSRKLNVIGVTGTDGKSTTVWLIHQLLSALGKKSGFISTVEVTNDSRIIKNPYRQSTPEAPLMHGILENMVASGSETAVVEATSHGLSKKTCRLKDVLFDVAVLTNITHEHLEFHGSIEQYRSDKAELFRSISHGTKKNIGTNPASRVVPFGVINLNDTNAEYIIQQTKARRITYGIENQKSDLIAENIEMDSSGTSFTLLYSGKRLKAFSHLPGTFNVENLMAACCAIHGLYDVSFEELAALFPALKGVRGRMTEISCGQQFRVIVDYAHTPEAFEKVFSMLRPLVPGRIISVFGSAGERDITKRPMQGGIASQYCDIIVLTDEDPRLENSEKILGEILAGCKNHSLSKNIFLEPDRKKAIRMAFSFAKEDDAVILLGKGHEASIIYPTGPVPWDEIEVAKSMLHGMGYTCS